MYKDDVMSWHKSLFDKGWIAPSWPKLSEVVSGTLAKIYF